jgi:hypothetical protein
MTNIEPWAVGAARGAVLAALTAGTAALITATTSADVPVELQVWAPIIIAVLRAVEGVLDTRWNPGRQSSLVRGGRAE